MKGSDFLFQCLINHQDTEHLLNHSILVVPSWQNDSVDQVLQFPSVHQVNPDDVNGGML